ncbi:TonB-dependent receptor [Komagataeibacter europaeus]|uniref:TonB-dependent receptor n=1 Tax=Komagataeibacter europaeus TaxID=33995 RepID=UPI0002D5F11C|nr:TonB-dependent receptor [Komagataeibacter europaeus]GBQ40694.1 TonB-dependent outer membrane receptor [Komagataeibacter europaeus LMG 18890]
MIRLWFSRRPLSPAMLAAMTAFTPVSSLVAQTTTATGTPTTTTGTAITPVTDGDITRRSSAPDAMTVTARLDRARIQLQPSTGATVHAFSRKALETIPGGDNAGMNSVLLQAPGVAQDSYGQIHVRGDHNEVQFRLDGVQLPEGLNVFGQTLMTRFADNLSLSTGALPVQYGFLQAAVVDINTKNGSTNKGGNVSIYGGARDYFFPSAQYGGQHGKWDYFFTADYVHDRVGIENTTPSFNAPHDLSNQYHFLGHVRYTVDENTRISLIAGVSNAEYQLPNIGGQPMFGDNYSSLLPQAPGSSNLNERQKEITDFGILSLQKTIGAFSLQTSVFSRYSSLGYSPDPNMGDLAYMGISQHAERSVMSTGTQSDVTWRVRPDHTIRFGFQVFGERNITKADATVFNDANQQVNIHTGNGRTGDIYGLYVQDEWQPLRNLTVNYGLRFDGVGEYTDEHQLSPRINVVWRAWKGAALHAGYSRYFTPPPFEVVGGTDLRQFANTSAATDVSRSDTVKAERDHYFDAGIEQVILPGWRVSFDAYYKLAHNLIDEGQFGAPIILSGFNYRRGQVNGYEFSTSYDHGPLSLYGNFAWSRAIGKDITSAQFNFDADDLKYISQHWIHLDHDQRWTASAGGSYTFFYRSGHPTRISATMVYGSGLRQDSDVPNGGVIPQYATFNMSVVQSFRDLFHSRFLRTTQLRLDVTNLFDHPYMLRSGTGVGVGAPQYGLRRTILTGISQSF